MEPLRKTGNALDDGELASLKQFPDGLATAGWLTFIAYGYHKGAKVFPEARHSCPSLQCAPCPSSIAMPRPRPWSGGPRPVRLRREQMMRDTAGGVATEEDAEAEEEEEDEEDGRPSTAAPGAPSAGPLGTVPEGTAAAHVEGAASPVAGGTVVGDGTPSAGRRDAATADSEGAGIRIGGAPAPKHCQTTSFADFADFVF